MKEARKPDLHAPRFRRLTEGTVNAEFYQLLREKVPAAKDLTDAQIKELIFTFNGELWQTAIDKRDGVEIPEQIGHLFIGTCPPKKKKNVDFKQSADYLKVIEHRNWESDNYLAKIFFTTYGTKYRFKNHELWGFIPTRAFKRMVGKTYPVNWKRYIEVDPHLKLSHVYRKNQVAFKRMDEAEQQINTYNEFEL
jgi:hypothetical protein